MRLGWVSLIATVLAVIAPTAVFAQSSSNDWFAPPPSSRSAQSHQGGYHQQHCSLDQRDYAYINECGELIPSIWDPFPGRGDQ